MKKEIGPLQQRVLLMMLRCLDGSFIAMQVAKDLDCSAASAGVAMKYLAKRGLLQRSRVSGRSTNSRSVYKLTDAGIEEAQRWDRLNAQNAGGQTFS